MKFSAASLLLLASAAQAFTIAPPTTTRRSAKLFGYLDDLNKDLYAEADNPDIEADLKVNTDMSKEQMDRAGPGDWGSYVEFDEFDGGDGQMGVAGDGNKGLEKFGDGVSPSLNKSKSMSAKNAWGTSTGYADELIDKGVEISRAQQLENWANQQEISKRKNAHRALTETFDAIEENAEADWRTLAKFGVERNQDFDLDEAFGEVTADGADLEGTVELHSSMGQNAIHELNVRNEYMGFADFRASFTADTNPMDWSIEPKEGSLSNREDTAFILRFRPQAPGVAEGHLVIETEDFKKTWKLVGSTA